MKKFTKVLSNQQQATVGVANCRKFFDKNIHRLVMSLALLLCLFNGAKSYAAAPATLAYAGGAYAASNGCPGTTVIIQTFQATNSAARNITNARFVTGGTYVTADVTHFQVWKNTSYTLTGATLLGTFASAASGSTITGATTVTAMGTGVSYYMITATIAAAGTAVTGHKITIAAITGGATNPFTVSGAPPTYSGTITVSGAMTIQAIPTGVTATATPTPLCVGSNLTLTGVATGAATYAWAGPGGTAITAPASEVTGVTGVVAGNAGVYTLTASTAFCSVAATTAAVVVHALPTAILGNVPLCVGSSTTLSDASGAGTWTSSIPADATIGTASGLITGVAGPSNPVITYVNTATGCSVTAIASINAAPTAILGPDQVCTGYSITLSDVIGGGVWTSSAPGTASVGAASGTVTGILAGTTTISYTTAACAPVTVVVTVNASPAAISGPNNVCIYSSTTVSDVTGGGLWTSTFPGIASIDPSLGTVTGNAAGNTDITYTITSTGCYAIEAFTVNALPVIAAIGGVTHQCLGLTSTLTETTGGGVWSSAAPATASIGLTGIVTGNLLGTTTMSYTVTNGFGCVNTVTTPDTVTSFPVVDAITGLSSVCVNSSITLSDNTLSGVWSSSNTSMATINASTGDMTGVSAGALTITYTVTNNFGCATSVTMPETINPLPVVLPITGSSNECAGTIMQLNDAIAGGTWSSSNTSVATVNSTGVVSGIAFGSDNISYTVSSGLGCLNTAVYAITIGNPMPASAVVPYDTSLTLCHGNPENLIVNTTGTGLTYQWYMNSSPILGATNSNYIVTVAGQYIVQLNNGTCSLALPYTDVINPPLPVIGYNTTGPELFTGNFYTYQWFRNDTAITAISSGSASAVLPVSIPGFYTVVVSDANGCFDTSASFQYPIPDTTTGITNVAGSTAIRIYPNPANSVLNIDAPVSVHVSILTAEGRVIMAQKAATAINVDMLSPGMYIIMIYDDNDRLLKNDQFTKIQ